MFRKVRLTPDLPLSTRNSGVMFERKPATGSKMPRKATL